MRLRLGSSSRIHKRTGHSCGLRCGQTRVAHRGACCSYVFDQALQSLLEVHQALPVLRRVRLAVRSLPTSESLNTSTTPLQFPFNAHQRFIEHPAHMPLVHKAEDGHPLARLAVCSTGFTPVLELNCADHHATHSIKRPKPATAPINSAQVAIALIAETRSLCQKSISSFVMSAPRARFSSPTTPR